jgi:antitoxin MazE
MKVPIRRMGNSQGVLIPKPLLAQLGFEGEVDMEIENGTLVLRRPRSAPRLGWAQASAAIADAGEGGLVMGEFANAEDGELEW